MLKFKFNYILARKREYSDPSTYFLPYKTIYKKMYKYGVSMVDVLTKKQRSYNMSMIRGRNTKPEIRLRKFFFSKGLRGYRLSGLPGKPDIIFPKYKTAIFIDGCFWHKCPEHFKEPATRKTFWAKKMTLWRRRNSYISELRSGMVERHNIPQI